VENELKLPADLHLTKRLQGPAALEIGENPWIYH
jgi:hypothetical protein